MSSVTVRQQYIWLQLQFVFPDSDKAPAIDLAAFDGKTVLVKIPRQVAVLPGLEIEYCDRYWLVKKVRCSAKDPSARRGVVPIVTLEFQRAEP